MAYTAERKMASIYSHMFTATNESSEPVTGLFRLDSVLLEGCSSSVQAEDELKHLYSSSPCYILLWLELSSIWLVWLNEPRLSSSLKPSSSMPESSSSVLTRWQCVRSRMQESSDLICFCIHSKWAQLILPNSRPSCWSSAPPYSEHTYSLTLISDPSRVE